MTAIEKLIATAKEEIGYQEKASNSQLDDKTANAGNKNYTKYARDLAKTNAYNGNKNGYAWCDVFVDWCFVQTFGFDLAWAMTGQPTGGCGAGCGYSAQYYKALGQWFTTPQAGDQIFFKNGSSVTHTGIVSKVDGEKVYTIEGNTSGTAGVVAEGGQVAEKSYSLTDGNIYGYGRPKWELVPDERPWNEAARDWAMEQGITDGTRPTDPVTREEVWAMLQRFHNI